MTDYLRLFRTQMLTNKTYQAEPILDTKEYYERFAEPKKSKKRFSERRVTQASSSHKESDLRAGRALSHALDIRKFEIELYWKRATYFWTFIAAAFAGYAITYKTGDSEPKLLILFSALGLVFSFAWYLVNRGSKFWQSNWERHVDLLEDMTLGPLYKIVAVTKDNTASNFLTSPAQFSVSKVNQILSVFIIVVWSLLFIHSLVPTNFQLPFDLTKVFAIVIVFIFILLLLFKGKTSSKFETKGLHERSLHDKD